MSFTKRISLIFPLLMGSISSASVEANSPHVDLNTEIGRGYFAVSLNLASEFQNESPEAWHLASWNLSFGGSQSKFKNSSESNQVQLQRSVDASLGLDLSYDEFFSLESVVYGSATQETRFRQVGFELRPLFYTASGPFEPSEFEGSSVDDKKRRYLRGGAGVGLAQVTQNFDLPPAQHPNGTKSDTRFQMHQNFSEITLGATPVSFFSVDMTMQLYSYSKERSEVQALEYNPAYNFSGIDLTTSMSELPESSGEVILTLHPSLTWELSLRGKNSKLFWDESIAREFSITWTQYQETSNWGLGFTQYESFGTTENTVSLSLGVDL